MRSGQRVVCVDDSNQIVWGLDGKQRPASVRVVKGQSYVVRDVITACSHMGMLLKLDLPMEPKVPFVGCMSCDFSYSCEDGKLFAAHRFVPEDPLMAVLDSMEEVQEEVLEEA